MMHGILRREDELYEGLRTHCVRGLSILSANRVDYELPDDPIVAFTASLRASDPCSAHTGALAREGDTPEETVDAGLPHAGRAAGRSAHAVFADPAPLPVTPRGARGPMLGRWVL